MWQTLYSDDSIHKQKQAEIDSQFSDSKFEEFTKEITEFNSRVWNEKKDKGLSLKDSIKITIPDNLTIFSKDFVSMHNIEK